MVDQIRQIDPTSVISVCAAGRAGLYMTTLATMMGLHIRVGTEDTPWRHPNSDVRLKDNLEMFEMARTMELTQREIISAIVLPSALPDIFAGLRLGLTVSLILAYSFARIMMVVLAQIRDALFARVGQNAVRELCLARSREIGGARGIGVRCSVRRPWPWRAR